MNVEVIFTVTTKNFFGDKIYNLFVLIVYSFEIWKQFMLVLFSVSADTNGKSQKTRPCSSPSILMGRRVNLNFHEKSTCTSMVSFKPYASH
jgi:hypothetical protein